MNFTGKVIGAVLGWFLLHGHPFGILLGIAIGHIYDVNAMPLRGGFGKAAPRSFVEPLFALAGALCKSDGRVSQSEISATEALMGRLQLDQTQRQHARESFTAGKHADFDVRQAITDLRAWSRGRRDLAFLLLDMLLDIVYAEGQLAAPKLGLLRTLCQHFDVSEQELAAISAMKGYGYGGAPRNGYGNAYQNDGDAGRGASNRVPNGPDPYAVLGITRDADERAIKRAYRKLMSQYHPDKLGDVPAEMKRRSEMRATEINAAYEKIKNQRGIK